MSVSFYKCCYCRADYHYSIKTATITDGNPPRLSDTILLGHIFNCGTIFNEQDQLWIRSCGFWFRLKSYYKLLFKTSNKEQDPPEVIAWQRLTHQKTKSNN